MNNHFSFIIMKRTSYFLLALLVAMLFTLTACDKLDAPYKKVKKISAQTSRKVLLEDFTGHTCVNCPTAHEVARGLQQVYEGHLILISIHAGFYAWPAGSTFPEDFRCETGEELYSYFAVTVNPIGMVNRTAFGGAVLIGPDQWTDAIGDIMPQEQQANLLIDPDYNTSTRKLKASVETKFLHPQTGTYRLSVYIVEDSIVAPQKNNDTAVGPTPDIMDYLHRNVLRGSMNGTWGDVLATNPSDTSRTYTSSLNFDLDPTWVEDHCKLIAFVYNDETKEILQAEEVLIIP